MKKLLGILLLVFAAILTGCSKEPAPQDRFAAYIALWNQQKFDKMYNYLSNSAKKTITKKEFTTRYEKIYHDLQITDLKINFKKPKEDKREKPVYSFTANMNSIAGPIQFTEKAQMRKQEKNWYVDWNTGFIFPNLQKGDKISLHTIAPVRGEILDRHGNQLATNGEVYEVGVVPGKMGKQKDQDIQKFATLLKMTPEQINQDLDASWVKPDLFVPLRKVSMDDRKRIAELVKLGAVRTMKVGARIYPFKEAAAQLTGYVGPITADELAARKDKGYTASDIIGKRGLEQVYDEELRGKSGEKITIEKADGSEDVLAEKPVENGKTIKLTVDANLQMAIYNQLKGDSGAAGALNPVTGETLALVSSPSFDPNEATLGFSVDEWNALQKNQALTTRFKETYAPGSVLKPITASVGLDAHVIDPAQSIEISGLKWQKDKSWGKYFVTRVHEASPVNLEKALVFSDNIYFAQAALKMGKTTFTDGLKKFGFEEELNYPFPLVTSSIGNLGSEISLADSGYGQGQVQTNIVQLMDAYTPFVNKGTMVKPTLLLDDPKGQALAQPVSAENATLISGILRKVVSDPSGTAHAAEIPGYPLAGKTGTAEIKEKQGETGKQNGWFVAYNTNKPNLLIAMMVENVQKRGGSEVPVKKVKKVFEAVR